MRSRRPTGDVPVWTWTTDHTAGWVLRRMAHETAAHLGDAAADRRHGAVDRRRAGQRRHRRVPAVLRPDAPDGTAPLGGSVHLHCTDVAGEWFVVDGAEGGLTVTREHAKGDCALRGAASDLLFVLWRRLPLDRVDVVGDARPRRPLRRPPGLG